MTRRLFAVALASLVALATLVPAVASAQAFRGGTGRGHGHRGGFKAAPGFKTAPGFKARPFGAPLITAPMFGFNPANPMLSRPRFHHPHFRGGGFGFFGVGTSPVVLVAPDLYGPPVYEAPPVYYPQPIVAVPTVTSAVALVPPAPAAPPQPTVVEFSSGRYELRGDGMTAPYAWVWIPNPPAAPPPSAEPEPAAPRPRAKLYRWTDENGIIHLTDQPDTVPEQHRTQPKQPS